MEPIQKLTETLDAVAKAVDHPAHDPDPTRSDWGASKSAIGDLRARMERDVFPDLSFLTNEVPPDAAQKIRNNVAFLATELAVLSRAVGDETGWLKLLRAAEKLSPDGTIGEEITGAMVEPEAHVALCRARWHQRQGSFDEGDRILRAFRSKVKHPGLKKVIELVLNSSRPLDGAPALFRFNGFGVGIYGERDRRDDGSYVTTHCISALFVPVWPLSAYRVKSQGYNSYLFMSREPLSSFAKGYRWFAAASVVLAIAWSGVSSWYFSPARLASVALAEAQAVEASGNAEATLAAYDGVFSAHAWDLSSGDRDRAAESYVTHLASTVPSPLTAAQLDAFDRAMTRFAALPESIRTAGRGAMSARVGGWADELGAAGEAEVRAALHVIERGQALATSPSDTAYGGLPSFGSAPSPSGPLAERARDLHRALGGLLAAEWPLDALAEYVATGPDGAACDAAAPLVREIVASPSLVLASRASLASIADHTGDASLRESITLATSSADAMAADPERATALESGDEGQLRAALARQPGDQEVVAALADLARARGDAASAITALTELGGVGRLVPAALRSLAAAHLDAGRLDDARALLSRQVQPRLAELRDARAELDRVEQTRSQALISRLEMGLGPPEIESRLRYADTDEQRAIVMEYLSEQFASDPEIASARRRYEAVGPIVPSILQLAMIELRRGGDLSGEERDRAFAEAERLFLSIQAEGASVPEYHLGLGQVYHRLGRADQGEQELQTVLASGDDGLALAVATAYREIGMVGRAREVAEGVWQRGATPHAGNAAMFMSVMADRLDDVETWLSRAPQDAPEVQVRLLEARAGRALERRDYREAEQLYAQVARDYERRGATDTAAVNNAAVAWESRYAASGDPAHLDEAITRFERAVRLSPEESLAISNLARAQRFRGTLRVLSRWIDPRALGLDSSQADTVLSMMLASPTLRDEVVAALREDPSLRRTAELSRQEQVLAPNRPDGWQRELSMLEWTGDVAALRELDQRVARLGALAETASRRDAWEGGDYDDDLANHAEGELADLDERIARARRSRDARAIAVLSLLRGSALLERHLVRRDAADVDAAIEAYREGVASWPELGAQQALAYTLVLRAATTDAEASARFEQERRRFAAVFVLRHLASASAEAATRLRASTDLREAASLVRTVHPGRASAEDAILAQLTGDASLAERAAAARAREDARLSAQIEQRLDPSAHDARERLEVLGE